MKQSSMQAISSAVGPIFRQPDFLQCAALCLRQGRTGPEVLLVSTLNTQRWILPKGWPMKGRTLAGAARREAWEEAGVVGKVGDSPIGYYSYRKVLKGGLPIPCRVEVFRVDVEGLERDYPEKGKRRRRWFSVAEAVAAVEEPELKALLETL